jgi:hypothetical protein
MRIGRSERARRPDVTAIRLGIARAAGGSCQEMGPAAVSFLRAGGACGRVQGPESSRRPAAPFPATRRRSGYGAGTTRAARRVSGAFTRKEHSRPESCVHAEEHRRLACQPESVSGKKVKSTVGLRGLPKGRFTVKITLRLKSGNALKGSRSYKTCTKKKTTKRSSAGR